MVKNINSSRFYKQNKNAEFLMLDALDQLYLIHNVFENYLDCIKSYEIKK